MIRKACLAIALCISCGQMAGADTFGGVTLTSDYVAGGFTQTGGRPAVQGYIDHTFRSGLYVGAWASTVDFGTADNIELDLYGGFRGGHGKLSYDVGYFRYYYDRTGDCCGDLVAKINWAANDKLSFGVEVKSNLNGSLFVKPKAGLSLSSGFGLTAEWEYDDNSAERYWGIGASKSFGNGMTARLNYYDRTDVDSTIVLSVSFDTQLFK